MAAITSVALFSGQDLFFFEFTYRVIIFLVTVGVAGVTAAATVAVLDSEFFHFPLEHVHHYDLFDAGSFLIVLLQHHFDEPH